jgi:hypothetical protein
VSRPPGGIAGEMFQKEKQRKAIMLNNHPNSKRAKSKESHCRSTHSLGRTVNLVTEAHLTKPAMATERHSFLFEFPENQVFPSLTLSLFWP